MAPGSLLLIGWLRCAGFMALLWAVEWYSGDATPVDAGWAFCLAYLACLDAWAGSGGVARRILLAALAGVWGLRLGAHILLRHERAGAEDGRYRAMRSACGRWAHSVFFLFFQLQALVALAFSVPFLIVAADPARLGLIDSAAIAVWLIAVAGESLADRQLASFRSNPSNKGRTCREGLWRYSRHPNYFFEWLHWWAYCLLAAGAPRAWATLAGPLLMFVFLYKVTGLPYTEEQALKSRGDDYREYQRTTNAFFPWFPKS